MEGKERSWVMVIVLSMITFGIYAYYWMYRIHGEATDAFRPEGQEGPSKDGFLALMFVSIGASLLGFGMAIGQVIKTVASGKLGQFVPPSTGQVAASVVTTLAMAGAVVLLIGAVQEALQRQGKDDAGAGAALYAFLVAATCTLLQGVLPGLGVYDPTADVVWSMVLGIGSLGGYLSFLRRIQEASNGLWEDKGAPAVEPSAWGDGASSP